MAVTTKTLTPTNQTITLPDMTERPNASVLVDGTSKEADAINALSDQMGKYSLESKRTNLTGTWNLNDLLEGGVYKYTAKPADVPDLFSYTYGEIVVFHRDNYYYQIVFDAKTRVFYRVKTGNDAWVNTDQIAYKSGETFTQQYVIANGYVTEGSQQMRLAFYAPRSFADINTITLTSLKGSIRGAKGYVDNASTSSFDILNEPTYTVSVQAKANNYFEIRISKSSAFANVDNNTPVSAYLTISFTVS